MGLSLIDVLLPLKRRPSDRFFLYATLFWSTQLCGMQANQDRDMVRNIAQLHLLKFLKA